MPLIPITVFTYTEINTPLSEVRISVWTEEYDLCVFDGITDENGLIVFALDAGVYNIFLHKNGLSFGTLPYEIEIIDNPVNLSYRGQTYNILQPTNGTVYLYGDVKDLNMNPLISAKVQVHLTNTPQIKNGAVLDKTILEICTDETGRWGALLPSGSIITVTILGGNFQRTGILPFTGPVNILDLV